MTEDEAKTKLCPMAATFGGNQQLVDGPGPFCIGSACMAWRVQTKTELRHKSDGSWVEVGRPYLRNTVEEVTVEVGGFCGLAGRPE